MILGNSLSSATGIILAIDEPVAELLRYTPVRLIGRSYLDITHPDDRPRNVRALARLETGAAPLAIRKRYLREDGTSVSIDLLVSRFGGGRDADRMVGSFQLVEPSAPMEPRRLWMSVRRLLAMQRQREEEFGADLCGDHAWTILLHVYLAEAECRILDIGALSDLANVPKPMVQRWIKALTAQGLVEAGLPRDAAWQLTPGGVARVERLLARFALA